MPPQSHRTRQMPADTTAYGAETAEISFSRWRLFQPEYEKLIDFRRPSYDKREKTVTVIRIKPCAAYAGCASDFMPYRLDPGGKDMPGFWLTHLIIAQSIGTPGTSFIVHRPTESNPFMVADNCPLSVLCRAVSQAVKRGQGKQEAWRSAIRPRAFEPNDGMLLKWGGMFDGATGKSAELSYPKPFALVQALVPQLGGKVMFGPHVTEAMPGWGEKTCIVGLSGALTHTMMDLLSEEVPNYRGSKADFENRYVQGDPVAVDGGRFVYIYPKGGDPRLTRQQNAPSFDPLTMPHQQHAAPGQKADDDEIGYGVHLEHSFQHLPAPFLRAAYTPEEKARVTEYLLAKWLFWEDILYVPDQCKQVEMLSESLPISMIEYAFVGEHESWLNDAVRKKIAQAHAAVIPTSPSLAGPAVQGFAPPSGNQSMSGFSPPTAVAHGQHQDPLGQPPVWNNSSPSNGAPTTPADPFPPGSTPFDRAAPDQSLPGLPATLPGVPNVPAALPAASGIADALRLAQAESPAAVSGPALPGLPGSMPSASANPPVATAPAQMAASTEQPMSAAALAAKKRQQPAV